MHSFAEENYLKAIFKLLEGGDKKVTTNAIAAHVATAPASVTDMLRKLAEKKLIRYERYQGVSLTPAGKKVAVAIIRKHRLWELFLVNRLGFAWDEVHDIAEQLEHIRSEQLVQKLDAFLGKPKFDPHGDPIPDEHGVFHARASILLSDLGTTRPGVMTGVVDHSPGFLRHLAGLGLSIGHEIRVRKRFDYDGSCIVSVNGKKTNVQLSSEAARNILVTATSAHP